MKPTFSEWPLITPDANRFIWGTQHRWPCLVNVYDSIPTFAAMPFSSCIWFCNFPSFSPENTYVGLFVDPSNLGQKLSRFYLKVIWRGIQFSGCPQLFIAESTSLSVFFLQISVNSNSTQFHLVNSTSNFSIPNVTISIPFFTMSRYSKCLLGIPNLSSLHSKYDYHGRNISELKN